MTSNGTPRSADWLLGSIQLLRPDLVRLALATFIGVCLWLAAAELLSRHVSPAHAGGYLVSLLIGYGLSEFGVKVRAGLKQLALPILSNLVALAVYAGALLQLPELGG